MALRSTHFTLIFENYPNTLLSNCFILNGDNENAAFTAFGSHLPKNAGLSYVLCSRCQKSLISKKSKMNFLSALQLELKLVISIIECNSLIGRAFYFHERVRLYKSNPDKQKSFSMLKFQGLYNRNCFQITNFIL